MKEPMVITMAREYASGGSEIAQAVADKLGIPLYNKELITLAAKKSGLTEEGMLAQQLQMKPAIGKSFEHVRLLDKKDVYDEAKIDAGGFCATDDQLQSVEMDDRLELTPEFPYNWMYDATMPENAAFTIRIHCKALVLIFKDSGEVDVGKAYVDVDGERRMTADPHINNWQ